MTAFATLRRVGVLATALVALASGVLATGTASAETAEVHISKGYGILYLPMIVMEHEKLLEKQAKAAGLGDVKVGWLELDGGNIINDAMISGNLDIAAIGVPTGNSSGGTMTPSLKPRRRGSRRSWSSGPAVAFAPRAGLLAASSATCTMRP